MPLETPKHSPQVSDTLEHKQLIYPWRTQIPLLCWKHPGTQGETLQGLSTRHRGGHQHTEAPLGRVGIRDVVGVSTGEERNQINRTVQKQKGHLFLGAPNRTRQQRGGRGRGADWVPPVDKSRQSALSTGSTMISTSPADLSPGGRGGATPQGQMGVLEQT